MRHSVFLTIVLALAVTAGAQDWEGDLLGAEAEGELHGTLDVTWDSQYLWRGYRVFGNKSATHLVGDLNLWETGFGVSAAGHYANGSGYTNWTRWDYSLYYQNGVFAGERYATNFRFGWVLYDYPSMPSYSADLQEGHAVLSWPNLLPIEGLCPTYVVAKTWPSEGGSTIGGNASGWFHMLMLDYGFTVEGMLPNIPEHLIRLHGEVVYNDGVDPYGRNMDHEVTHAVLGVATDLKFGDNLTLTPAVYYQATMERKLESYNGDNDDELWASLGLKYSF